MDSPDANVIIMQLMWDSDGADASLAAPAPAPRPTTQATPQQPPVHEVPNTADNYRDPDLVRAAAIERRLADFEADMARAENSAGGY